MLPMIETEASEQKRDMERTEHIRKREVQRGPRAVGEELVRRRVLYALVCAENDDRVLGE